MFYYLYYGYIGGTVIYKIYEYSHMVNYAYNILYFMYGITSGVYNRLVDRKKDDIELDEWELV